MQALYDIPAPAKLNLFLHITGRRADGYHLLQSAFMLIDWCDQIHLELRKDGQISREDLTWALPEEDLCVRAAKALQRASGSPLGVHMGIAKSVPAQAGMGGGSSDAASTLLALNRLWNLGWTQSQLAAVGLQLGADVPFFLLGQHAWVQGIGEQLTPIDLPAGRFAVLKPESGLDTGSVFAHPDLERNTGLAIISGFAANPYGFGRNDLQPVAELLCPAVSEAVSWFNSQGLPARMTGSGSAVFAPLHAETLTHSAPGSMALRLCNSLEAHPLQGWCA